MTKKFSENREFSEWQSHLVWLNPGEIEIDGDELQWTKIGQETTGKSFCTLEKMRPFLGETNLFDDKKRIACRDKLFGMKNENGERIFDDQDLRFFELYFGGDRIKIDRLEDGFDVTNGRHRIWQARQSGIRELPVLLNEKVRKENVMSNFELADIEKESLEQHEEAEEMKEQIEQHQERVIQLELALQQIRAASAEIGSDRLREVERHTEEAKLETERQLEENRKRRDELLWENKELAGKVIEQNEKRKEVHNQVGRIKMMFEGASDEFKSEINRAGDALSEELEDLAELEESLLETRNKLEGLKI